MGTCLVSSFISRQSLRKAEAARETCIDLLHGTKPAVMEWTGPPPSHKHQIELNAGSQSKCENIAVAFCH